MPKISLMENLDKLDHNILAILMKDAELSYKDIASQLFVSPGTVHVRVKKMKELGIIKGTYIQVDYDKLGFDIAAFLGIYLDKSSLYDDVAEQLTKIPEVVGVHYTTGLYNIFAKIICKDTTHLRQVLHDKIQNISGIQRTETFISLQESIDRPLQILKQLP
ncbi:MAG: Lrp/AsnC ligand binding domain-containing protein [Saprospiraceae bacterium]|nr:Lrp/AsnC ligand binding domain-containing protein [Saprospiraceae bacterium]